MTPFIIGAIIGFLTGILTAAYGLDRNWSVHKAAIIAVSLSVAVVSALWIVGGVL